MKSIERRFNNVRKKNINYSDYVCLAEAVLGQQFSRRRLYTYFKKLVSIDDYDGTDTNMLVRHLYKISNTPDECIFLTEIDIQPSKIDKDDTYYVIGQFQVLA